MWQAGTKPFAYFIIALITIALSLAALSPLQPITFLASQEQQKSQVPKGQ